MRDIIILIATLLFAASVAYGAGTWGSKGQSPKLEQKAQAKNAVLVQPAERDYFVTGETINKGLIGYVNNDGKMWLANYSTAAKGGRLLGISHANYSTGRTGTFTMYGTYSSSTAFSSYSSPGMSMYLKSAGAMTVLAPSRSGLISRVVGWFKNARKIVFRPDTGTTTVP